MASFHRLGAKAVFLGDLVDRGPMAPQVVELVRAMVAAGHALCVPGNHDVKFVRAARGRKVQLTHGLARTLEQYALRESVHSGELVAAADFLDQLISHYALDEGRLVVAHAGLTEPLQGRSSGTVREFCLYGDVTGETDDVAPSGKTPGAPGLEVLEGATAFPVISQSFLPLLQSEDG
jgi:protein phosphatase